MEAVSPVDRLPEWVTLLRAPNPGPMTLDGTNTWILRAADAGQAVVVDPGPLHEEHLARITEFGPVQAILVTHGHFDHVEGAARLAALLGDVPVLAADPKHASGQGPLQGGERLTLGGLTIKVIATPGHTMDSVCFEVTAGEEEAAGGRIPAEPAAGQPDGKVIFTGDTILGRGTTVVAYPDGDLGSYLASLRELSAYEKVPLLPGHGPALSDCAAVARGYLTHREQRLEQVRAAMAAGAGTADEVVTVVYPEIDKRIRFAAIASARAQIDFLRRESQGGPEQLDRL